MDAWRVRETSKQLVGGTYRLEIADVIREVEGPFSAQSVSDTTGIAYPRVQEDLKRLLAATLIKRLPRRGTTVEYEAAPSVYWEMCSQLLSETREREG